MPPHRVLMVDDDPFAFKILQTYLGELPAAPTVEYAASYDEGMQRLRAERFDACLLDYNLGTHSGLDFLKELSRQGCRVPVLMLTAQRDPEVDHEAMKAGAVDFLVKGEFGTEVLARALRYAAERARNEERLRESEERYALAVAGANDGIWDWRIEQQQLYVSPRWSQIVGLTEADAPGSMEAWIARVHSDDRERVRGELDNHVAGQSAQLETEHRLLHADGSWRWVVARGSAVRDGNGRASRVAGSLTDVTHARSRDPLTGLPNRILYLDRLERALARKRRDPSWSFAVLFLDVDRFKVVNDSLGHLAGDKLLVGIARRLDECLREVDTIARLGGDEFTILLEGVSEPSEAIRIAERILHSLSRPFEVEGRAVYSGGSIGIAMARPEYRLPEEVLRDADTAMYRAKSAGRSRYQVFDQKMHDEAMAVLQLESELREAVERGELRVLYQPVVRLGDGALAGFEALVRWQHPRLGFITPDRFIALAEETGVIDQVDRFVLKTAAAQLSHWRSRYPAAQPLYVAVNASKRHVDKTDFVDVALQTIDAAAIPRSAIALEITEGLVFSDPERVCATLQRLKDAGVQLLMDDFGTGYSSLSYMHKLPITGLKIDRSFTWRLDDGGSGVQAVRAIIALSNGLGLTVTAEGVETKSQENQLIALGCHHGQGYLFAKPLNTDDAEKLLRKQQEAAA